MNVIIIKLKDINEALKPYQHKKTKVNKTKK